jgi:hypothetical protein
VTGKQALRWARVAAAVAYCLFHVWDLIVVVDTGDSPIGSLAWISSHFLLGLIVGRWWAIALPLGVSALAVAMAVAGAPHTEAPLWGLGRAGVDSLLVAIGIAASPRHRQAGCPEPPYAV